jgi:hypothetical protein
VKNIPITLPTRIPFAPFTNGTTAELTAQMLKLNKEHTIYDPEFRPPTFRREDPSIFTPATAILVTVTLKRKRNKKIEGEDSKPTKKAKNSKNMGTAASKKKVRVEQASNGA